MDMIFYFYDQTSTTLASRSHPGALGGPSRPDSGCLDGDKDRGAFACLRRPTPHLDNEGLGTDTHESESMDSWRKRSRLKNAGAQTSPWTTDPFDGEGTSGPDRTFGASSESVWSAKDAVGWTDAFRAPEAAFWNFPEGASGADMDASIGLRAKTGWTRLSSSPAFSSPAVRERFKKNSEVWALVRRSFSKTRRALRFILDWVEVGQRKGRV